MDSTSSALSSTIRGNALASAHWRTRDGELRLISWTNTAMLGEQGDVRFVVGSGIDVTERLAVANQQDAHAAL